MERFGHRVWPEVGRRSDLGGQTYEAFVLSGDQRLVQDISGETCGFQT